MTTFPIIPSATDHVLVASPSTLVRQRVLQRLLPKPRRIEHANGGAEALVQLEKGFWQVLFLDRQLPDLDAEELSQTVRARFPAVEVVLLDNEPASHNWSESELPPAISRPESSMLSEKAVGNDPHQTEQGELANQSTGIAIPYTGPNKSTPISPLPGMIGDSPAMQVVYRMVKLVAPRNTTVLITGPTGSGKELVARSLHELSPRAARTFAVVNCAAIPETMLEAELFGYSRGAFTGAMQSYAGRIQTAHLGTLFLDEIGDMPLSLQPKLLRFLEQKELQRLGSSQMVRVDARVVAATNVDLSALVRHGRFRADLYYRLSAFPVVIPPLSGRPADLAQLAAHFLEKFSAHPPALSEEASTWLRRQSWPGNIRELQNVIERAVILASGERFVLPAHLMAQDATFRNHAEAMMPRQDSL